MDFQSKKIMPRFSLVVLLMSIAGICALGKAIYTMTIGRERWVSMKSILVKEGRTLPAKRGNILAADGSILAASLPEYKIFIDFMSSEKDSLAKIKDQKLRDSILTHKVDTICEVMHEVFPDIIPDSLKAHLLRGRKLERRYWPVYVNKVTKLKLGPYQNRQISYIEYSKIRTLPLFNRKSSTTFLKVDLRRRPYGEMANRTIGYFKDSARYGLELAFDSILRGKPGLYHRHKVMDSYIDIVDQQAEDGYDIQTTLDVGLQQIVEKALRRQLDENVCTSALCVLMEVETGDVKAICNLTRHADGSHHEDTPLAITDLYEPGAVFKPQSFLVAFDDGKISMNNHVDTGNGIYKFGRAAMKDHNWKNGGYGVLSVPMIIANSSNIGVSRLIDSNYGGNPRAFVDGLYRIGSAEDLQVPIPGYQKPRIRRPGEGRYWARTTLPWMSIGYEVQVTPINTVTMYNGIANNGRLMRPRFVKAIMRDGVVVRELPPVVLREHMAKPEAIRNIQICLETVVTDGVGKKARSKRFGVAGKTGTAQVHRGGHKTNELFVTFVGYFPTSKPKYSCIVCVRKSGPAGGGLNCAPVFREVAETVMSLDSVADYTSTRDTTAHAKAVHIAGNMRSTDRLMAMLSMPQAPLAAGSSAWGTYEYLNGHAVATPATATPDSIMPNVMGYGLRDAMVRLEQMGLRVKCQGSGRVAAQSVHAGDKVKRGTTVTLTLEQPKHKGKKPAAPKPAPKPAAPDTTTAKPGAKPEAKPQKPETKPKNKAEAKPKAKSENKPKAKPTEQKKKKKS